MMKITFNYLLNNRSFVKIILGVLLISGLVLSGIGNIYSEQSTARNEYVRITFIEGNGLIHHGFNQNDEEAIINSMLLEGDSLETYSDTKAELIFANGIIIRMNENSKIHLLSISGLRSKPIIIKLIGGDIIVDSSIASLSENSLRIDTINCSIYLTQESSFRVVSDQFTDVLVYEGSIDVATENNTLSLGRGQRLLNVADPESQPEYFDTLVSDDFAQWNESRQASYSRTNEENEYSDNIEPYDMYGMEEYGNWKYEPDYGNVWVPYVTPDWQPYLYGKWAMYPSGWGWISYEPWGWAPYHYGRWGFNTATGWFWIPKPIFGLGWVSWYSWDNYVGWSPLDYYDRPIFFDHPAQGYYRPNLRSWTVIPKDRLGYEQIYRYRIDNTDKLESLLINKDNVIKGPQFTYRPNTLPNHKLDPSITGGKHPAKPKEYQDFPKKPVNNPHQDQYIPNPNGVGNPGEYTPFRRLWNNVSEYDPNKPYYDKNSSYPQSGTDYPNMSFNPNSGIAPKDIPDKREYSDYKKSNHKPATSSSSGNTNNGHKESDSYSPQSKSGSSSNSSDQSHSAPKSSHGSTPAKKK